MERNTPERSPSNIHVAVIALAQLGGATRKVHHEHVAALAYSLAPDKFGWIFPEYRDRGWPDKEAVRSALEDAKKAKHGRLVGGGYNKDPSKDGWTLTAAGAEWALSAGSQITLCGKPMPVQIAPREAQRFRKQVKASPLFKTFTKSRSLEGASQYLLSDLLECSPDAPKAIVQKKFDRLLATARVVGDDSIVAFLAECQKRYSRLLAAGEAVVASITGESDGA